MKITERIDEMREMVERREGFILSLKRTIVIAAAVAYSVGFLLGYLSGMPKQKRDSLVTTAKNEATTFSFYFSDLNPGAKQRFMEWQTNEWIRKHSNHVVVTHITNGSARMTAKPK